MLWCWGEVRMSRGLPGAIMGASAFEVTPEGIKREKDVDRSDSTQISSSIRNRRTITLASFSMISDRPSFPKQVD